MYYRIRRQKRNWESSSFYKTELWHYEKYSEYPVITSIYSKHNLRQIITKSVT
jgi:hypothetical protein